MPVVRAADAPVFRLDGTTVTGLASPSRGAVQTSAWRLSLAPGTHVPAHVLDAEEVFIILSGSADVLLGEVPHRVAAGDAFMVPPGASFALTITDGVPFDAVCAMAAGGRASLLEEGGEPFQPPWAI